MAIKLFLSHVTVVLFVDISSSAEGAVRAVFVLKVMHSSCVVVIMKAQGQGFCWQSE